MRRMRRTRTRRLARTFSRSVKSIVTLLRTGQLELVDRADEVTQGFGVGLHCTLGLALHLAGLEVEGSRLFESFHVQPPVIRWSHITHSLPGMKSRRGLPNRRPLRYPKIFENSLTETLLVGPSILGALLCVGPLDTPARATWLKSHRSLEEPSQASAVEPTRA